MLHNIILELLSSMIYKNRFTGLTLIPNVSFIFGTFSRMRFLVMAQSYRIIF